jgi:hypothetical protein
MLKHVSTTAASKKSLNITAEQRQAKVLENISVQAL